MNKKGFTLVELLATLVILSIVIGLTIAITSTVFKNAKAKTEGVFIATIEDALDMYLDSDARKLSFSNAAVHQLSKTHGVVNLYKATSNVTFEAVINDPLAPITLSEMINPANKDKENYECFERDASGGVTNYGTLEIYRDADYVYYYKIAKADFKCLNDVEDDNGKDVYITNLPCDYLRKLDISLPDRCSE